MTGSILDVITEQYHTLTRSGKKLADYLFHHASEAQYLSISALAAESGVSEASITRFCRALGLSGYNDLKLALAKAGQISDLGEPWTSPEAINSDDSLETMFHKLHAANLVSLNETLALLDESAIQEAVNILFHANRVFCFGNGGSMVMAMEAWARFSTASAAFVHIADSHMQVMATSLATPNDAILFFSYSGSTAEIDHILTLAHSREVPIILVTHFPQSQAARLADVVLLCGYNESPLQSGSIAAKVGQLFLIDCLFYGFCKKNPERFFQARSATAEAIAKKLL